jgi:UDPglucose 6-dehydrogenase
MKESLVKKIVVVGAGYVGLVTGACFAQKNNHVIIVENNQEKIKALLNGQIPFYEPGLDSLVASGIANKTITFVNSVAEGMAHHPEVIFSCVGTPSQPDGSADLSYVYNVAAEIGANLEQYCLVINKSTVPVGTAQQVRTIITEKLEQRNMYVAFDVASNPEFLKEGDALNDFFNPDRIVIGIDSPKAAYILSSLYQPFVKTQDQILTMNIPSAELTKYASNAMLATRISFMNQIALLADNLGANIDDVKQGIALDKRIGKFFLNAGIGYGGSCFPKDVKALIHMGHEKNVRMSLIETVDEVNNNQRQWFIDRIIAHYGQELSHKVIGLWGLAFKPETDDIRCAPSLDIIQQLLKKCKKIITYDPVASSNVQALFGDKIDYAASAQDILHQADFLIIATEWHAFKQFKPVDFLLLKDKTIFDGRNCFEPGVFAALGMTYVSVGRNEQEKSTLHSSRQGLGRSTTQPVVSDQSA